MIALEILSKNEKISKLFEGVRHFQREDLYMEHCRLLFDHDIHLVEYVADNMKNAKTIFQTILKEKKKSKNVADQLTDFGG